MFSDEYLRGRQNYENFAQNLTFNFYEFDPEKFTANSSYDYIAAMGDLALVKLGTLSEDRDGNFVSRARAYASNMYYNEAVSETDVIEDRISEHVFIGLNNKIVSAGRYDAEKLAGLKRELDQRRAKLARESIMVKVPGQEGYINLSAEEAQSLSQLYGAQYTTIENTGDGLLEIRLNDGIREYERFKKTDGSMMYERFYNLDGSFRQVSRQISEKAKEENTGFGIRLNQVREQVETTAYFSRQGGLLDSITEISTQFQDRNRQEYWLVDYFGILAGRTVEESEGVKTELEHGENGKVISGLRTINTSKTLLNGKKIKTVGIEILGEDGVVLSKK